MKLSDEKYSYLLINIYDRKLFYFFKKLITLEIINSPKEKIDWYRVCSTYEIDTIINDLQSKNVFYNNHKIGCCIVTPLMIKNNKITLRIYDEKIDTIDCKDNFLIDEDKEFNPLLFNHNFYSYFPEYKQIDKILYIRTEKSLFYKKFVFQQLEYKNILKLTGPSGIGKSFFLLYR